MSTAQSLENRTECNTLALYTVIRMLRVGNTPCDSRLNSAGRHDGRNTAQEMVECFNSCRFARLEEELLVRHNQSRQ